MKQFGITILLTVLMSMFGAKANAHDIELANKDGVTIYYKWINNNTELAVTYQGDDYWSSPCYTGDVVIPESVEYEGKTFSVTSIDKYAFYDCSGLTSVTIPNSVTNIGFYAFWGCSGLTSITIPSSVTSLKYAFSNCSGLTSIIVEEGNTVYDSRNNCNAIIETATNTLLRGCNSTTIPNTVTTIDGAFSGCNNLYITIPNSVTSIGSSTFQECTGTTTIIVEEGNPVYDSRDNCNAIIETASDKLIAGCNTTIIPNSVKTIGGSAFMSCRSLTSITIPNSVTHIEPYAFASCSGLTSVYVQGGLTSIGANSFIGSMNITDFYLFNEDVPIIFPDLTYGQDCKYSLFGKPNPVNATLHVPAGSLDAYKADDQWTKNFKEIVAIEEEETTEDVIKITSAGQTTWCSAYDLDFTDVEGLKAYIASGYHRTKGTIWLTRVKEVPAGEGILLIGDAGDYKVPHKSTTAYYANLMVGTVKAITLNETDGEYTNYYLSSGASGVGFYKVNGSVDLKANRAYLPLLKSTTSGSRGFIGMDFDDDEDGTTGIDIQSSIFNLQSNEVYYNLHGQRVDNPGKGVFIKNGRKVVIK